MEEERIKKLTMPKWGLSMTQGKVVEWLVPEETEISLGMEILEVETEKITGNVESTIQGVLRRHVARAGEDIPVGGLLAIIADPTVDNNEIDRFVANFAPDPIDEKSDAEDSRRECVEVAGHRLSFVKLGDGGQPVLMIHGFGGDLNSWLFNHGPLAAQRSVYALDLPGHGQSSKDVIDGTVDMMADAIESWLDTLELPPVSLIGHSLGGAIALALARRAPDRVISCTLIASAGLGAEIDDAYIHGFIDANRRKQLKPHLEKLFADSQKVNRQLVDDTLKFKRLDGVRQALSAIASSFISAGNQSVLLRDQLDEMSQPVCVLWGAQDKIIPAHHAEGLPASVAVHILDDCGHMVHMEAAGEVNRIVESFLVQFD